MDRALEELVWERAEAQCEYCQMPQEYDGFTHEVDHIRMLKRSSALE